MLVDAHVTIELDQSTFVHAELTSNWIMWGKVKS